MIKKFLRDKLTGEAIQDVLLDVYILSVINTFMITVLTIWLAIHANN
jgi:hypothetical protein